MIDRTDVHDAARRIAAHVRRTPTLALDGSTVLKLELVANRGGAFEGELEVETATGKGRVPFTLFATTW